MGVDEIVKDSESVLGQWIQDPNLVKIVLLLAEKGADLQALTEEQAFRFPSTFTFIFRSITSIDGIGKTLDEAFDLACDTKFGLTSSIYTTNVDIAERAKNELRFGETYVNRENFEAIQGFHAGMRQSGIGGADGKHGLEEYLASHVVYVRRDPNAGN